MASFDKTILMGNLTRDPELRYTPKGTAFTKLTLAVNRKWKSERGEAQEEVSFIDVDVWGKQAEVIAQYLKKGNPLLVEGRLKQDTWEKDGQKHSKVKVVLESFTFVGVKKEGDGEQRQPAAAKTSRTAPTEAEANQSSPDEGDDVPF